MRVLTRRSHITSTDQGVQSQVAETRRLMAGVPVALGIVPSPLPTSHREGCTRSFMIGSQGQCVRMELRMDRQVLALFFYLICTTLISTRVLSVSSSPWAVAHRAPLSMGFSRQEQWSGLPFPTPGDLPDPGIKPESPTLQADSLPSDLPGKTEKAPQVS